MTDNLGHSCSTDTSFVAHFAETPQVFSADQLAAVMDEYENNHAVEEYEVFGWHVWPLLRTELTFQFCAYWNKRYSPPTSYTRAGRVLAVVGCFDDGYRRRSKYRQIARQVNLSPQPVAKNGLVEVNPIQPL
jgi:hypothetical protein